MVTKEEVLSRLRQEGSYEQVAAALKIPPGQVYLVATGLPADGSDSLSPEQLHRRGIILASPQKLSNPPVASPASDHEAMTFLRRRVESDTALKDAALRRDATPPDLALPEDETEREDVVDVLGRDHNQVKYLLEQLEAIPPYKKSEDEAAASRRKSILDMIVMELAGHEAAEEAHFWPAVGDQVEGGKALVDKALSDEQEAKETLEEAERTEATESRFDELVEKIAKQLRKHVAFEDTVFLKVKAAMPADERVELGRKVIRAKAAGPTRPHAKAGSSPVTQKLGPVVGATDKLRDKVGKRPAQRHGTAEEDTAEETG